MFFSYFYFHSQEASSAVASVNQQAAQYLATKVPHITDPYQMAIVAYALQAANHRSRDDAYNRLKAMRRSGQ